MSKEDEIQLKVHWPDYSSRIRWVRSFDLWSLIGQRRNANNHILCTFRNSYVETTEADRNFSSLRDFMVLQGDTFWICMQIPSCLRALPPPGIELACSLAMTEIFCYPLTRVAPNNTVDVDDDATTDAELRASILRFKEHQLFSIQNSYS